MIKNLENLLNKLNNNDSVDSEFEVKIDTQNIANYIHLKSQDQLNSTFTSAASKNVMANNDARKALNKILTQSDADREYLEKLKSSINPKTGGFEFKRLSDNALHVIRMRQGVEKEALENYVSSEQFKTSINNPEELETIKQSLIDDLNNAHIAQVDAFNKSTTASLRELHMTRKKEQDRITLLASLAENPLNKDAFKKLVASKEDQTALAEGLTGMAAQIEPEIDPNIAHIQLADLKTIYTFSGNTIYQPKPGTFHLEVGCAFWPKSSINKYNDLNRSYNFMGKSVEQDLALMAASLKASGADIAAVNVNYENPKLAEKRAQQSFKAFVNAGFPPEKIKLTINGKVKTAEELFEKEPNLLKSYSEKKSTTSSNLSDSALHDMYSTEKLIEELHDNASSLMRKQLNTNRPNSTPLSSPTTTSNNIHSTMK